MAIKEKTQHLKNNAMLDTRGLQTEREELQQAILDSFLEDFPQWIKNNINWSGIADDMRQDYSEVVYNEITYLYR